jgi:ankyrin repeat protein
MKKSIIFIVFCLIAILSWGVTYKKLTIRHPKEIFVVAKNGLDHEVLDILKQNPTAANLLDSGGNILVAEGKDKLFDVPRLKWPPLLVASQFGQYRVVRTLLQFGANVHFTDEYGINALHLAARSGQVDLIKYLSRFIDIGDKVKSGFFKGKTPLHFAAMQGNLAAVKLLLSMNADPNSVDANQKTPLDLARINGYWAVVNILKGLN